MISELSRRSTSRNWSETFSRRMGRNLGELLCGHRSEGIDLRYLKGPHKVIIQAKHLN